MAAVSQGWRLGGAIKLAERRLAEGTRWHAGQALMAWCVGNAKIDPLMALQRRRADGPRARQPDAILLGNDGGIVWVLAMSRRCAPTFGARSPPANDW
jgi:hypothetical protein